MAVKTKKIKKAKEENALPLIIKDNQGEILAQYDRNMIETIKNTVAKNATDEELVMLLSLANRYGLDPFAKEIWFLKYGTKDPQIFTSRDGFVKIAKRDSDFKQIQSQAVYENDEFEVEQEFNGGEFKITNFKHKFSHNERGNVIGAYCIIEYYSKKPLMVYVDYNEYKSTTTTWKKNPSAMIRKVSEKEACRQSAGISGLHIPEEMGDGFYVDSTEEDFKRANSQKLKMAQSKATEEKAAIDEDNVEIIDVDIEEMLQ